MHSSYERYTSLDSIPISLEDMRVPFHQAIANYERLRKFEHGVLLVSNIEIIGVLQKCNFTSVMITNVDRE